MRMWLWSAAVCLAATLWAQGQETPMATLRVTCRPAATLWVNHRQNRTGESFTLEVPANAPTLLRLSAPGYVTQWRTVTPGPGERRHEPFELAHEPIPVLFRSERPATVLCDGAEWTSGGERCLLVPRTTVEALAAGPVHRITVTLIPR